MRRVFICGFYQFPRGSAASNYVQYLSMALIKENYKVVLITDTNKNDREYLQKIQARMNNGLSISPVVLHTDKIRHYIEYKVLLGRLIVKKLEQQQPRRNDIVICYSSNNTIVKAVLEYSKQNHITCGACIVEWYPDSYFENEKARKLYGETFEKLFPKYDFLFPISTYIQNYFEKKGCKTMCLPIMADPYEYKCPQIKDYDKVRIVYPGNGRLKDAWALMFKAIVLLSDCEIERLEFHICGITKDTVRAVIGKNNFEKIESHIVFHDWMTYDDLIQLYDKMHYLLLIRDDNQLTRANFPSKVPEVMSHGVVPIVSVVGDYTKYYLANGVNSIFLKSNSLRDIYNTLKNIANIKYDDYISLSNNSYYLVCDKFSYHNWSSKIKKFTEQIKGDYS